MARSAFLANLRAWLPAVFLAVVLGIGGYFAVKAFMQTSGPPKKPPKISLLPDKPPPPPPPPKIEKKPESPKEQKEVKVEQQAPKDAPPPDPTLKMEGAAGEGPSLFAAGRVTSDDLSKLGAGGREPLVNPFSSYANALKNELQRQLARHPDLRRRQYRIEVRVWVGGDGSLRRTELLGSTGDGDTDDSIRRAFAALPGFSEAPPPNMPQPIRLRIVTSGRA